MSYYTVVKPCVVGKLHYATVPDQPIEADDAAAAPLVESGALQPYPPQPAAPKEPRPAKKAAPPAKG